MRELVLTRIFCERMLVDRAAALRWRYFVSVSVSRALVVLSGGMIAGKAHAGDFSAETDLITETIATRERLEDYDAARNADEVGIGAGRRSLHQVQGLRAGNFFLYPSVGSDIVFDDNIYGEPGEGESDVRSEITPQLRISSQLPRHVLDLSLGGRIVTYNQNSNLDYANFNASARGALHFDHAHTLSASILTNLSHEEVSELTAPREASEPTPVWHHHAAVGLTRDVGRLYGTVSMAADRYDYSDVRANDGSIIDQDVRDLDVFSGKLKVGYRFSPGFEMISQIRFLRQVNDATGANDFDASGVDFLAGVAFETGPLLRWRLLGGYGVRDYDSAGRDNLASSLLEAQVEWLPTRKLTVTGTVARSISDTVTADFGGLVKTTVRGGVDYEIYHNLVAHFGLGYEQADFEGDTRLDDTYSAHVGLEYNLNQNWLLSFNYDYQLRDSNDDAFDLDRNQFRVGAKFRY